MITTDYIEQLNPVQKEAVFHNDSPLLILAGAGSGKTRVITAKIAYLIEEMGMNPGSILAVTFTNKAAREMRSRINRYIGFEKNLFIRTFHSFGAWMLRRNSAPLGLNSSFSIYDDDDSLILLHSLFDSYKRRELVPYSRWISRAKDYCLSPMDDLSSITNDPDFPEMYEEYEKKLREMGNVDFGDLILLSWRLLNENPEIQNRLHQRFKVILVDEYQDSNVAQYMLLKALVGPETLICVVGDDDQSIYRFRGAEVKNILTFPESFPGTKVIRLEQNYRSTKSILKVASSVVSQNEDRMGKTLFTENSPGDLPVLRYCEDHQEEARFCADLAVKGNMQGTAILYRTNAQSIAFENCFTQMGIPYKIIGALRFYEREEIKDIIALLKLLVNRRDEVSFRRIVNKPSRGIGKASVKKIINHSVETGMDLITVLSDTSFLSGKAKKGAAGFYSIMKELLDLIPEKPLYSLIQQAVSKSGLLEYYKSQDQIAGSQKVRNLDELVNAGVEYEDGLPGLTQFLEDLELDRSAQEDQDQVPGVTLITMHNTKGLEFDRVIITGLEDELFPGRAESVTGIEEERRIFYVSVTRARDELYMTSCRTRLLWGRIQFCQPSRFLDEIPGELIQIEGNVPSSAGTLKPGTRVCHNDYGPGFVFKEWHNGDHYLVMVRFDSGQTAQFMPEYTPLEILGDDDY